MKRIDGQERNVRDVTVSIPTWTFRTPNKKQFKTHVGCIEPSHTCGLFVVSYREITFIFDLKHSTIAIRKLDCGRLEFWRYHYIKVLN